MEDIKKLPLAVANAAHAYADEELNNRKLDKRSRLARLYTSINLEQAFEAGARWANEVQWNDPAVSMPEHGTRAICAVLRNSKVSVRIIRASHKETTDDESPIVFKALTDDEKVIAWKHLPIYIPS